MRVKLTWTLILMIMFVCIATGCQTAARWEQCDNLQQRSGFGSLTDASARA